MKFEHLMFEFHGVSGAAPFKLADGIEAVPLWAMLPGDFA
jgi:hypothetical protein